MIPTQFPSNVMNNISTDVVHNNTQLNSVFSSTIASPDSTNSNQPVIQNKVTRKKKPRVPKNQKFASNMIDFILPDYYKSIQKPWSPNVNKNESTLPINKKSKSLLKTKTIKQDPESFGEYFSHTQNFQGNNYYNNIYLNDDHYISNESFKRADVNDISKPLENVRESRAFLQKNLHNNITIDKTQLSDIKIKNQIIYNENAEFITVQDENEIYGIYFDGIKNDLYANELQNNIKESSDEYFLARQFLHEKLES